jgi:hypothetical protein
MSWLDLLSYNELAGLERAFGVPFDRLYTRSFSSNGPAVIVVSEIGDKVRACHSFGPAPEAHQRKTDFSDRCGVLLFAPSCF